MSVLEKLPQPPLHLPQPPLHLTHPPLHLSQPLLHLPALSKLRQQSLLKQQPKRPQQQLYLLAQPEPQ